MSLVLVNCCVCVCWKLTTSTNEKKVPMQLYIMGPVSENETRLYEKTGFENMVQPLNMVTCLGKCGVLCLAEGITVAFLSGTESEEKTNWTYNQEHVQKLIKDAKAHEQIDILLTYQWPRGVEAANAGVVVEPKHSSSLIGKLVIALKPRLHIAAGEDISFSSQPMAYGDDLDDPVTEFVGLTDFQNHKAGKWLYGLNFPIKRVIRPLDFDRRVMIPFRDESETSSLNKYFFSEPSGSKGGRGNPKKHRQYTAPAVVDSTNCWFCFSNEKIERIYIVAIAENVYMALPKGPVNDQHLSLLPIQHHARFAGASKELDNDVTRFLGALSELAHRDGRVPVWYERCYKSPHTQIHWFSVEPEYLEPIENFVRGFAKSHNMLLVTWATASFKHLAELVKPEEDYFSIRIGNQKGYVMKIGKESSFPINFGRLAIASSLGIPHRANWQDCVQEETMVTALVAALSKAFKPFNFTLED